MQSSDLEVPRRWCLAVSTRVLVRPIGLDMVEVGGSIKCDPREHLAPSALGAKPNGAKQAPARFEKSAWSYQMTNPRQ